MENRDDEISICLCQTEGEIRDIRQNWPKHKFKDDFANKSSLRDVETRQKRHCATRIISLKFFESQIVLTIRHLSNLFSFLTLEMLWVTNI